MQLRTTILIPRHCSSMLQNPIENKKDEIDWLLYLRVTRNEGILWREICPLLFSSSSTNRSSLLSFFLSILLDNFHSYIIPFQNIQQQSTENSSDVDSDDANKFDFWLMSSVIHRRHYSSNFGRFFQKTNFKNIIDRGDKNSAPHCHVKSCGERDRLFVFILPPHPSPNDFLYKERLFASRLCRLENFQIRLQTLNAYIATLGGGYFLCRYLSTAVACARYQRQVALAMGDIILAAKCTINEAYNYIHFGHIPYALKLLRNVLQHNKDPITTSMCQSAILFAKRVYKAQKHEDEIIYSNNQTSKIICGKSGSILPDFKTCTDDHGTLCAFESCNTSLIQTCHNSNIRHDTSTKKKTRRDNGSSIPTETIDDFQRIRIVRDRTQILSY